LKQLLRYQISGTIFLLWLIVFYFGIKESNFDSLIKSIFYNLDSIKTLTGFISALPIGVIIHQISVLIKNFIVAYFWEEFDDKPNKEILLNLCNKFEFNKYILDRISNLNSFYYVRIDNGLISPLLSWIIIFICFDGVTHTLWTIIAVIIAIVLISYLPRIRKEIKIYNEIIDYTIDNNNDSV